MDCSGADWIDTGTSHASGCQWGLGYRRERVDGGAWRASVVFPGSTFLRDSYLLPVKNVPQSEECLPPDQDPGNGRWKILKIEPLGGDL